jgi:Rod binding domain-containing protein
MDFLGGAEVTARTEMLGMTNTLQQAQIQAKKTEGTKDADYMKQIKKVSADFESIFLGYMLKQMRKTVPEDPLFGNTNAKDIFYDMYDDATAKELSKAGGIGLAAILYKQLSTIENSKKAEASPEIKPIQK